MYIIKETKLEEKITKNSITSFRKEAQLYNKAIQKISTPLDLYEVGKSMQDYCIKLRDFLESRMHNRVDRDGWVDAHGNSFSFSAYQDFYMYVRDVLDPYKIAKRRQYFNDWDTYDERLWKSSYEYFEKRRTSIYTMFSQKLKKGFDNLEAWLETFSDGYAPDRSKSDYITYKGLKIKVTNDEAHENFLGSLKNQYTIEHFKKDLDKLLNNLKQKRIQTDFLYKATFEFNNTISLSIGGDYLARGNIISVIPQAEDTYYTLVHEVGHCYEETVISKQARLEWTSFYDNPKNFVYITDDIINNIRKGLQDVCKSNKVLSVYNKLYSIEKYMTIDDKNIVKSSIKESLLNYFSKDSPEYKILKSVFDNRSETTPIYLPSELNNSEVLEKDINFFISLLNSTGGLLFRDRIALNGMSLYSAKNELEAFADMFSYFVLDYHTIKNLSVEFIQFFKSILGVE